MVAVYKILSAAEWADAQAATVYRGSEADRRDGFIHLSDARQVRETATRHFAGRPDLVLVVFAAEDLPNLRWEASRGGELFPHVYGKIETRRALSVVSLPLTDGRHRFPPDVP
jgi:uncharacterized protein (DUF952 family)